MTANLIRFTANDTLGATKVYNVIADGARLGTVTRRYDHRFNRFGRRISFFVWSYSCDAGECDGYRTRAEAAAALLAARDLASTVYEDDVLIAKGALRELDIKFYKEIAGTFPRGQNRWAFAIVGKLGSVMRLASGVSFMQAAADELREYVKANAARLAADLGTIVAIRALP